jgi:hypothetical protein
MQKRTGASVDAPVLFYRLFVQSRNWVREKVANILQLSPGIVVVVHKPMVVVPASTPLFHDLPYDLRCGAPAMKASMVAS